MRMFLIVLGAIIGAFVFIIMVVTGIGALLPVAHVASRSEYFPVSQATLYDMAMAQFHRTNDGSFAVVEQTPPDRLVTAIVKEGASVRRQMDVRVRACRRGNETDDHGERRSL
jgi:hypothetical protein